MKKTLKMEELLMLEPGERFDVINEFVWELFDGDTGNVVTVNNQMLKTSMRDYIFASLLPHGELNVGDKVTKRHHARTTLEKIATKMQSNNMLETFIVDELSAAMKSNSIKKFKIILTYNELYAQVKNIKLNFK